jgi:hypothetical protein
MRFTGCKRVSSSSIPGIPALVSLLMQSFTVHNDALRFRNNTLWERKRQEQPQCTCTGREWVPDLSFNRESIVHPEKTGILACNT